MNKPYYYLTEDDWEILEKCGFEDYTLDFSFIHADLVLAIINTCRKWLEENGAVDE